jgi:hypothetical protein
VIPLTLAGYDPNAVIRTHAERAYVARVMRDAILREFGGGTRTESCRISGRASVLGPMAQPPAELVATLQELHDTCGMARLVKYLRASHSTVRAILDGRMVLASSVERLTSLLAESEPLEPIAPVLTPEECERLQAALQVSNRRALARAVGVGKDALRRAATGARSTYAIVHAIRAYLASVEVAA